MSSLLVQTQCLSGKVAAGKYLIIHLKRYLLDDGGWVKDMSLSFSVDLDDEFIVESLTTL